MRPLLTRLARSQGGAAAVEFAMVLPAFVGLIVSSIFVAQLMYEASSLRYAVEAAARCASVNTTVCTSTTTTQTYAASKYLGPTSPAPTFTASNGGCGHTVTGSVTYVLQTGVRNINVPLSASACFP